MYICIYVCIHKDVVFAMFVQTQIISCRCLVLPHSKYISICIIYTYIYFSIRMYPCICMYFISHYAWRYAHVFSLEKLRLGAQAQGDQCHQGSKAIVQRLWHLL